MVTAIADAMEAAAWARSGCRATGGASRASTTPGERRKGKERREYGRELTAVTNGEMRTTIVGAMQAPGVARRCRRGCNGETVAWGEVAARRGRRWSSCDRRTRWWSKLRRPALVVWPGECAAAVPDARGERERKRGYNRETGS